MADKSPQKWSSFQKVRLNRKEMLGRVKKAETATTRHAHKFLLRRWRNIRDVRRIIAVWALAVGCIIAVTALQAGFEQQVYQKEAGASGGTYAEAVQGPINTLNPLFATTSAEESASRLLFSRLMSYDSTGNLNYDLAQEVTRSEDGASYDVTIRSGVRWHDGTNLTIDDVVFTSELLKDERTRTQIRGWSDMEIEKIDDDTVRFTLPGVYAAFEHALTFAILPKHKLENVNPAELREHKFSSEPIGSGPFKLSLVQEVTEDRSRRIIHTTANTEYYKGAPKLARFQLHVYPDSESMIQALNVNEVNAAVGLSVPEVSSLGAARFAVDRMPVQNGVYAFLNTESAILKDRDVRRALQRATNTDELREKLGEDTPALDLPFTEGQLGESDDIPARPAFNPEQAAKILEKAGWKLGDDGVRKKGDTELRLSVVTTKGDQFERALEVLIGQWRKVGVAVDERIIDAADPAQSFAQTTLQTRNYDVLLYQLAIGRDPDVYAYWHSSQATALGLNLSNYSSQVSDDILSTARTALRPSLRTAKYISFAKQWLNDAPAIGLYQSTLNYVSSGAAETELKNVKLVSAQDRYSSVLYWTAGQQAVYKTP